jgi:RNA polymerase sigma factor (sigma-70 family)
MDREGSIPTQANEKIGVRNRSNGMAERGSEKVSQDIHNYLVERCLQGDRRAQQELYKLYAPQMFNVCRRFMGRQEEAEDALQEAFVQAFTKLNTFKFEATFGAWLKRIVINKCIGILQQKRLLTSSIDEKFDLMESDSQEPNEDIQYEVKKVMQAIDEISDGCKLVLNLYLFEGYDHGEIAEILNITESTSKAQYSKARKKVRQILAEKGGFGHRFRHSES